MNRIISVDQSLSSRFLSPFSVGYAPVGPIAPEIDLNDQVDISELGRRLSESTAGAAVRTARIANVRAAIHDGSYETNDKVDATIEALLRDFGQVEAT